MVCTIETVESRWSPRAIAGVRMLRGQSFTVTRSPDIKSVSYTHLTLPTKA